MLLYNSKLLFNGYQIEKIIGEAFICYIIVSISKQIIPNKKFIWYSFDDYLYWGIIVNFLFLKVGK